MVFAGVGRLPIPVNELMQTVQTHGGEWISGKIGNGSVTSVVYTTRVGVYSTDNGSVTLPTVVYISNVEWQFALVLYHIR